MRSRRSAYAPGASPGSAGGKTGAAAGAAVPFGGWGAGGRLEYSPVRVVPQPASNEAAASRPRPMLRVSRISAKPVFPGTDHDKTTSSTELTGPTGVRHRFRHRRNGLMRRSRAIVDGSVGSSRER